MPDLMTWPGFTFSWLWEMARSRDWPMIPGRDLDLLQQIFEHATNVDKSIAITVDDGVHEQPVPLRVTGCVAADDGVLGVLPPSTGWDTFSSPSGSDTFRAWRAGVWRSLGRDPHGLLGGLSWDEKSIRLAPERITGFPIPDAIDGIMLDTCARIRSEEPTARDLLAAAAGVRLTPREGIRRWRRYAITGIDLSPSRRFSAIDLVFSQDDLNLITILPAWTTAEESQRIEFVRALVRVGHSLKRSPRAAVARAQALGADGWCIADPDRARLVDEAVLDADRIWSHAQDRISISLFSGELGPAHLIALGKRPDTGMAAVLDRCNNLARLGYAIPGVGAYPAEFDPIELSALQYVQTVGAAMSLADLLLVAADAGVSLRAAYDALARLAERGLLVRPRLNGQADYVTAPQDAELINRKWPTDRFSLLKETQAARRRRLWMRVAQIITRPRSRDEDLLQSAQRLAPVIAPVHAVTYPELAEASGLFETTLADTAAALGAVYPAIRLPDLPAECSDLSVTDVIHDVLLNDGKEVSWKEPVPWRIVQEAQSFAQPLGDFLARLAKFRAIGALVPPCTEAVRGALNKVQLDDRDKIMLRTDRYYILHISPLHLVQTAGRFGWTLAEAHQRFARLAPIGLEIAYPQAELPDEIVYWYDLQALTTHFDGQEPAISGQIGWSYLEHAAEEIFDANPDEVPAKASFLRERLAIYATLFQFELDIPKEEESVA